MMLISPCNNLVSIYWEKNMFISMVKHMYRKSKSIKINVIIKIGKSIRLFSYLIFFISPITSSD